MTPGEYLQAHQDLLVTARHRLRPADESVVASTLDALRSRCGQTAGQTLQVLASTLTALPCPEACEDALLLWLVAEHITSSPSSEARARVLDALAADMPSAVEALAQAVGTNARLQHEGGWLLPPNEALPSETP